MEIAEELLFPSLTTRVNKKLPLNSHCFSILQMAYKEDARQSIAATLNMQLHQLMSLWEPLQKPNVSNHLFVREGNSLHSIFKLDVVEYKKVVGAYVRWYRIRESDMVSFWCALVECFLRCRDFEQAPAEFREWAFSVLCRHVLRERRATLSSVER